MKSDDYENEYDDDYEWINNYIQPGTFSRISWPTMKNKVIYISDAIGSSNHNDIIDRKIKNILSLGNTDHDYETFEGIKYHRIIIHDNQDENITQCLNDAIRFIENAQDPVLIHCQMGISRSVSIMIGYLMSKGYNYYDAYNHVKQSRRCANPNFAFQVQLMNYEI